MKKYLSNRYNINKTMITREGLTAYYFNIFNRIFDYEGLPDSVNIRYFNEQLFYTGQACFFKKNNNIYSLGYGSGGDKNIYAEDINGIAIGFGKTFPNLRNLTHLNRDNVECIPLYDTSSRKNSFPFLLSLIDKMTDLLRLQDNLITLAKVPYIISTTEDSLQAVINLFDEVATTKPVIIGDNALSHIENLNVFPLNNDLSKFKEIGESLLFIDSQIRRQLGVSNSENTDKKERLLVDEINANNEITNLILEDRFEQRKQFIENVNKYFNLNISVKIKDVLKNDKSNNIWGMEENQQSLH